MAVFCGGVLGTLLKFSKRSHVFVFVCDVLRWS